MASPASMQDIAARYLNNAMLFEQLRRCSAQAKGDSRFSDSREVKVLETLQQVQSFYDPKRSALMNEDVYEVIRKLIEYKLLVERAQPLSNRQVSSTSDGRDTHRSTLYRTRSLSPVNEGRETQYLGKKKSDEKEKHESVMPSQNILALSMPAELHSKEICSSSTGTRGEPDDSLIKAFPSVRAFQRIPKGMEATLSPLSIEGVSESSDATTVSSTESDSSSNLSLENASSNSDRIVNRQNRTQVGPLSSHLTRSAPLKRNVVERQAKDEIKSDFTERGRGFPTSLVNLSQVWDFVTLILVNRYLIPKNFSRRNCEIGDGVLQLYLEIKFGIAGFRAALQNFAKHHQNSEVDGLFVLLSNPSKSVASQKNKRRFLIEATNPPFDTTSNAEEFCRLLAEYRYRYVTISFSKEEKKCIEVLLHTLLLSEFMRKEWSEVLKITCQITPISSDVFILVRDKIIEYHKKYELGMPALNPVEKGKMKSEKELELQLSLLIDRPLLKRPQMFETLLVMAKVKRESLRDGKVRNLVLILNAIGEGWGKNRTSEGLVRFVQKSLSLKGLAVALRSANHAQNLFDFQEFINSFACSVEIEHPRFKTEESFKWLLDRESLKKPLERDEYRAIQTQLLRIRRWMRQDPMLSWKDAIFCGFSQIVLREQLRSHRDEDNLKMVAEAVELLARMEES